MTKVPEFWYGWLFVSIIWLSASCFALALTWFYDDDEDVKPLTIPAQHMRCPEDSDLVVRYGVEPAGMWAFCLASDDVEQVLP